MKYRILFLATSLVCSTSYGLTVRDALIAAYKNNKELLVTRQLVIAKHESIVQAKGGFRPTVKASVSETYSDGMNKTDASSLHQYSRGKNRKATVVASQNLFKGGSDWATVSKTEHDILNFWAQLKDKEQEVFLNVIKAYLSLYAKFATVEVYKANLAFTKHQFESASTKRRVGEETVTQESLAEAKYREAESRLENGLSDLEAAKAVFEQLTGLVAPESVERPKELVEVPQSAELLQEISLRENPKITQAVEALASAKQDKKVKTGTLLPSLDLQASTTKTMDSTKKTFGDQAINKTKSLGVNNEVGLTLGLQLYDAGINRSQRRQASETIVQSRMGIEKAQQDLVRDCKQTYRAYLAAKVNMESTQKQVAAQEVAVQGTTQEMAAGTKIMFDVLNAQSQLLQAKLDLITAIQNYYTYFYQMLSLQGKLTATGLELPVEIFHPEQNYNEIKNNF